MTLCISKGELIAIDGAIPYPNTTEFWPIKLFSRGYILMSDNNIYTTYNVNPLDRKKMNVDKNIIDYDNVNIIMRNHLCTLLQYDNYYYFDYIGRSISIPIGAVDNISLPLISNRYVCFAYINYSDNNKLFIIRRPVPDRRIEIDTDVNIIFSLTCRTPSECLICYQKNNVIINCYISISNNVATVKNKRELYYDTYFSASVYTNQFLYYETYETYDNDGDCFCIFLYDENLYKIFMSSDNIPAVQKIYLDYQISYIKSSDNHQSIIYLQTTDNYIVKFNVDTFENTIVATDCSFFVAPNNRLRTKKSQ